MKQIISLSEESKLDVQGGSERRALMRTSRVEMIKNLTRRYTEVIDNAFLARQIASRAVDTLIDELSEDTCSAHFDFISHLITKQLHERRAQEEEDLFSEHLNKQRLVLGVSDDDKVGYKIPEHDDVSVTERSNFYKSYLYEEIEASTLNSLERSVVDILEKKEKLLWWFRNKTAKGWYAIQGWRAHKIRPDFVVAKKKGNEAIEVVYVLESKGEQLKGNPDSVYKKKVMERMTELKKKGQIKPHQMDLNFGKELNTSVEAHFIEEDNKEEQIGTLMK